MAKGLTITEHGKRAVGRRLDDLKRQGDPIQQQQLAERLGFDPSRLSKMLNGKERMPYAAVTRLATLLKIPVGDLSSGSRVRPSWAEALEELFEGRFRLLWIDDRLPLARPIQKRFSLTNNARRFEGAAQAESAGFDRPIAVVPLEDIRNRDFQRTPDDRLVLPYQVARWSQLTAMRMAQEPCYALYTGGILMTGDFKVLVNRRSDRVRTYPNAYASFGGAFSPEDWSRTDVLEGDHSLFESTDRELWEETKSRRIEFRDDQEILVMLEEDYTDIGHQHSVHVVALDAKFPADELQKTLELKLAEGTVHAVQFDPAKPELLARLILEEAWAPCGLAHYLVWLARGGPGLPEPFKEYALRLFDEVLDRMHARKSWRKVS